jgi:predicted phage terminase large subunit-like protein
MSTSIIPDLKSASKQLLTAERQHYRSDFGAFFKAAWNQLEPRLEFTPSPHYELLFEYAQLIGSNDFKKLFPGKQGLIVNIPPRTLKTLIFNVALPAWVWTHTPEKRFLTISHKKELVEAFQVKRRDLMLTEWYRRHFPEVKLKEDANRRDSFYNDLTGHMLCGSPEAVPTGLGCNLLIVDDLLNPEDAYSKLTRERTNRFFDGSLRSRRNNAAEDSFLIVCQRLHESDIVGHLLKLESEAWVVLEISMECEEDKDYRFPLSDRVWRRKKGTRLLPDRFPDSEIAAYKRHPRVWTGQYQQHPSPAGGFIFDPDRWSFYDPTKPVDPDFQIMSVDCAWKSADENDQTAIHVYGVTGVKRWLLHRHTARMNYVEQLEHMRKIRSTFPKISYVLVEEAANGYAIIKQLREEMTGIEAIKPEGSKETRANGSSADQRNVYLPLPEKETWVQREWIDHFAQFTGEGSVDHDDDIDAFSQAMNWLRSRFWSTEYLDKLYEKEVLGVKAPTPEIEQIPTGTCRACGQPARIAGNVWTCTECKASGRLNAAVIQQGF